MLIKGPRNGTKKIIIIEINTSLILISFFLLNESKKYRLNNTKIIFMTFIN